MRCIKEFTVDEKENFSIMQIKERINELIRNQEDIIDEIKEIKKEAECLSDKLGTMIAVGKFVR